MWPDLLISMQGIFQIPIRYTPHPGRDLDGLNRLSCPLAYGLIELSSEDCKAGGIFSPDLHFLLV